MRLYLQKLSVMDPILVATYNISEKKMFEVIARQIIEENVKFET